VTGPLAAIHLSCHASIASSYSRTATIEISEFVIPDNRKAAMWEFEEVLETEFKFQPCQPENVTVADLAEAFEAEYGFAKWADHSADAYGDRVTFAHRSFPADAASGLGVLRPSALTAHGDLAPAALG
jgi:hypothetical protein